MTEAQLMHRGEHFWVVIDDVRYEGECVWSWEENRESEYPTITYPVFIEAESIRKTGLKTMLAVPTKKKLQIAFRAAEALKRGDCPEAEYIVCYQNKTIQPDGSGTVARGRPAKTPPPRT